MSRVTHLARRYQYGGEALDDLDQVASLGLLKAIDRFDCARGAAFSSFAVPTIVGELKRHSRDTGWAVHVPAQRAGAVVSGPTTRRTSSSASWDGRRRPPRCRAAGRDARPADVDPGANASARCCACDSGTT